MKKIFLNILLLISLLFIPSFSYAGNIDNIKTTTENTWRNDNNNYLDEVEWNGFFNVSTKWEKWIKNLMLNIARDLRVIVFALVLLIWIIMVIKLIFWENTDEEQKKLKMWIIWASVWIIVMQIAFSIYKIMFDVNVDVYLAKSFTQKIIEPFTDMLMLFASFAFIAMGIYAFYKIITSWWDEEWSKKWKTIIIQAIIWFIVIKLASIVVKNTFNPNCNWWWIINYGWMKICEDITKNAQIIITIINWINTFLSIIIVIMIIYAWFLILTSAWDDEKQSKAKKIILYVWIWLLILFMSYLILTFFIKPESII